MKSFRDLKVYQKAFTLAMDIFDITKGFPAEEKYSLTSQIPGRQEVFAVR